MDHHDDDHRHDDHGHHGHDDHGNDHHGHDHDDRHHHSSQPLVYQPSGATWDGVVDFDAGTPRHEGSGDEFSIQGMNINKTQYIGSPCNNYTLVIPTDPNNAIGSALILDDPETANQFGQFNQPFLVNIRTIILTGNGDALVDVSSDVYFYGPLTILGGDGNYVLVGNAGHDTFHVGDGRDFLYSHDDFNDLRAGDHANDVIWVGEDADHNYLQLGHGDFDTITLVSGNHNEIVIGDGDNDGVTIGHGNHNSVRVGDGDNAEVTVGDGNHNTIYGGDGDNARLEIGDGNHNTIYGGDGRHNHNEHGHSSDEDGSGDVLIVGAGNHNSLYAADGDHNILVLGDGDHNLASAGDGVGDVIYGGNGDHNVLYGGAGGDVIFGGNGEDDLIYGGTGNDAIFTGTGADHAFGGNGNDFIVAGLHTETHEAAHDVFHEHGQDSLAQILNGGAGNDTFMVGGADTIYQPGSGTPLTGTEVIAGGSGADKFWFGGIWGHAVVTDFNGQEGDRILLGGVFSSTDNTGHLEWMTPNRFEYIHSAYSSDPNAHHANDLLILIGATNESDPYAQARSITLLDFRSQDTGGPGHHAQFDNVSFNNPAGQLAILSKIFDFSQADHLAVTDNDVLHLPHQYPLV